jgi:hypothetical protein
MTRTFQISIGAILVCAAVLGGYAAWYGVHRSGILAENAACANSLSHPEDAQKIRAPDGAIVPLMKLCLIEPVPPTLFELVRGHTAPSGVPDRMRVNSYTLLDALLGRYSVSPAPGSPCDQSATTTGCGALATPSASQSAPPLTATTTETIEHVSFSYPNGQGELRPFGYEGVMFPGNYALTLRGMTNYDLFFFTTPAPLSSINPAAASLDDYRTDYSPADGETVHIFSTEDTNINGIPMLRQRYSLGRWTENENGERVFDASSEADMSDALRYVFFDPVDEKFFILTGTDADGWVDYVARTIHLTGAA